MQGSPNPAQANWKCGGKVPAARKAPLTWPRPIRPGRASSWAACWRAIGTGPPPSRACSQMAVECLAGAGMQRRQHGRPAAHPPRTRQHPGPGLGRHLQYGLGRDARQPGCAAATSAALDSRVGRCGGARLGHCHRARRSLWPARQRAHLPDRRPVGVDAAMATRRQHRPTAGPHTAEHGHPARILRARPRRKKPARGGLREKATQLSCRELLSLGQGSR